MTMRSTSSAATPAMSSARRQAAEAWLPSDSPSDRMCRFLMPVRLVIQSSLVSTSCARSLLVRNFSGTEEPTPASRTPAAAATGTTAAPGRPPPRRRAGSRLRAAGSAVGRRALASGRLQARCSWWLQAVLDAMLLFCDACECRSTQLSPGAQLCATWPPMAEKAGRPQRRCTMGCLLWPPE